MNKEKVDKIWSVVRKITENHHRKIYVKGTK